MWRWKYALSFSSLDVEREAYIKPVLAYVCIYEEQYLWAYKCREDKF